MKKSKRKELKKIGIKNPFLYRIHSRLKSWEELKLKMWYKKKRNEIITNNLKGIEKDEWAKNLIIRLMFSYNQAQAKAYGFNTIYGEMDEYTYKKYSTLCDEYDQACNEELKKINPFIKWFFKIKSKQNSNFFENQNNNLKLIILNGIAKPTFRIIVRGNNFIKKIEKNSESDNMNRVTIEYSDKIQDDIVYDVI